MKTQVVNRLSGFFSRRGTLTVPMLLIAILVAMTYFRSLANGFTFDDRAIILENPLVSRLDWESIFSTGYWQGMTGMAEGLYRPITVATYALNFAAFGPHAATYHFANMMLHLLASGTLFLLARRRLPVAASFLAGVFFAVHPALSEAVNSVVGRAELLAACFGLLGVLVWLEFSERARSSPWLGVPCLVLLVASQLAKESGFIIVAGLCLYALGQKCKIARGWPPAVAALAGPVTKWWVTGKLLPIGIGFLDNPLAYVDPTVRVLNGFAAILRYLKLLIFPWPLAADYSYNQIPILTNLTALAIWLPLIMVASAGILGYRCQVWRRPVFLWVAISGGAVLAFSNVLIVSGTMFAERLAYLPGAGFSLMAGWALTQLAARRTMFAIACVWTFVSVTLANAQTRHWENDRSLFAHARSVSSESARCHFGYGLALHSAGDLIAALEAYERAVEIYPPYAEAHYNKGAALLVLDRKSEALHSYEIAANARPGYAAAMYAAAVLSANLGLTEQAKVWRRRYSQIVTEPSIDSHQGLDLGATSPPSSDSR
jgi:tetratricopeptide (TPR) repeat protein